MTKEQYSTKDEGEKKSLIINYYNAMVKGNFYYLLSAVSDVLLRLSDELSVIWLANDSQVEFNSVFVFTLSVLSSLDISVSEVLLTNDIFVYDK